MVQLAILRAAKRPQKVRGLFVSLTSAPLPLTTPHKQCIRKCLHASTMTTTTVHSHTALAPERPCPPCLLCPSLQRCGCRGRGDATHQNQRHRQLHARQCGVRATHHHHAHASMPATLSPSPFPLPRPTTTRIQHLSCKRPHNDQAHPPPILSPSFTSLSFVQWSKKKIGVNERQQLVTATFTILYIGCQLHPPLRPRGLSLTRVPHRHHTGLPRRVSAVPLRHGGGHSLPYCRCLLLLKGHARSCVCVRIALFGIWYSWVGGRAVLGERAHKLRRNPGSSPSEPALTSTDPRLVVLTPTQSATQPALAPAPKDRPNKALPKFRKKSSLYYHHTCVRVCMRAFAGAQNWFSTLTY